MLNKYLMLALAFPFIMEAGAKEKEALYKDAKQPVETRVADLMKRMTLEEKVAQMCQYVGPQHIRETQAKFKGQKVGKNDDAHGFYPTPVSYTHLTLPTILRV